MFYEQMVLAKKGILGNVWLAAHWEKKLKKSQISSTDITETTETIANPSVPLALRLSGHLLLGVVKIYSKKVYYLYTDASDALVKIKMAFRPVANVDLEDSVANLNAITLPEMTFGDYEIQLPDITTEDILEEGMEEEVLTLNPIRQKEMLSLGQPEFPIPSAETQEESIPNLLLTQDDFLDIDAGRSEYYEEMDYLEEDVTRQVEMPQVPSDLLEEVEEGLTSPIEEGMDIIREETESESMELVLPEIPRPKRKQPTLFDPETQLSSEFIQRRLNNPEMLMRELPDPPSTKRAFTQYERETISSDELLHMPSVDNLPEILVRSLQNRMQYHRLDESIDVARGEQYTESIEEQSIASVEQHGGRISEISEALPVDEYIPELPEIREEEEEEVSYEFAPTLRPSEVDETTVTQLSERSQRMHVYLQKNVNEERKLNFNEHFQGKKKRTVAISFWTLLELKSKKYIDLKQDQPYGNIEITLV